MTVYGTKKVFTMSASFVAPVCILFFLVLCVAIPGTMAKEREEAAVLQAARDFLEAELQGDHRAVYDCFAPSSPYTRDNSYEAYLRQVGESEDRLDSFSIVRVTYIMDNEDFDRWPKVEKFAQVEVELVFLHVPTERRSEINVGFIFMKEDGKWYKS